MITLCAGLCWSASSSSVPGFLLRPCFQNKNEISQYLGKLKIFYKIHQVFHTYKIKSSNLWISFDSPTSASYYSVEVFSFSFLNTAVRQFFVPPHLNSLCMTGGIVQAHKSVSCSCQGLLVAGKTPILEDNQKAENLPQMFSSFSETRTKPEHN